MLQFGNPVRMVSEPGLHFKVPFVQKVDTSRSGCSTSTRRRSSWSWATRSGWWSTPSPATGSSIRCASASRSAPRRAFRGRLEPIVVLQPAQRAGRGAAVHGAVAGPHPADEPDPRPRPTRRRPSSSASSWSTCASSAPTCRPRTARRSSGGCRPSASARPRSCARRVPRSAQRIRARADRERRVLIAEAEREVADPARPGRRRGDPDLRRGVRPGPGVLRLLPLDAGLSRRAGRRHHQLRAVAGQRVLPLLQQPAERWRRSSRREVPCRRRRQPRSPPLPPGTRSRHRRHSRPGRRQRRRARAGLGL